MESSKQIIRTHKNECDFSIPSRLFTCRFSFCLPTKDGFKSLIKRRVFFMRVHVYLRSYKRLFAHKRDTNEHKHARKYHTKLQIEPHWTNKCVGGIFVGQIDGLILIFITECEHFFGANISNASGGRQCSIFFSPFIAFLLEFEDYDQHQHTTTMSIYRIVSYRCMCL